MSDGRKNNKGTPGNKGGRKPKAQEQKLLERLGKYEDEAHEVLKEAVLNKHRWAVQLYCNYMYGKPSQTVSVANEADRILIDFLNADDNTIENKLRNVPGTKE